MKTGPLSSQRPAFTRFGSEVQSQNRPCARVGAEGVGKCDRSVEEIRRISFSEGLCSGQAHQEVQMRGLLQTEELAMMAKPACTS